MAILRRILGYLRWRKAPRRGYTEEVLYAGWVNTPQPPQRKDPG